MFSDSASASLRQRKIFQNLELESISQVAHSLMEAATSSTLEFTTASNFEQVQLMFEVNSFFIAFSFVHLFANLFSSPAHLVSLSGHLQHRTPIFRRTFHLGSLSSGILCGCEGCLSVPSLYPTEGVCPNADQIHTANCEQFLVGNTTKECGVNQTVDTDWSRKW